MGRIILLRHGQTYSNLQRILDTRPPGAELTDLGREQATTVGLELAELCGIGHGNFGRISTLISSIAIRAQQTAVHVAASLERAASLPKDSMHIDVRTGIHEISAGELQGAQGEEAAALYTDAFRGWLDGDADARLDSGENYLEVLERYQPVLESVVADLGEDEDAIVVSHGAAIRVVSTHACGVDPDFAFGAYLPNCRFVILNPQDKPFGQWKVERWADSAVQL
ncbi:Glucosyl-3-phosphoglycerate phosphatase [Corynebacterium kalinowskii]|uniref:Glucosyl-3-phosphoglycerate phosphatase n=1 Tax=Corynebacterium kalinowskii TaxID=2675216 RepID=A0A6B8V7H3_9CORY|nr:histidine phosphatase family protein [Corynebacterium kalinowskii]QGU01102.1 Glucosyl-3-phosphoglycerate phosphatase [Corynebacterium kalinowskii]